MLCLIFHGVERGEKIREIEQSAEVRRVASSTRRRVGKAVDSGALSPILDDDGNVAELIR